MRSKPVNVSLEPQTPPDKLGLGCSCGCSTTICTHTHHPTCRPKAKLLGHYKHFHEPWWHLIRYLPTSPQEAADTARASRATGEYKTTSSTSNNRTRHHYRTEGVCGTPGGRISACHSLSPQRQQQNVHVYRAVLEVLEKRPTTSFSPKNQPIVTLLPLWTKIG